MKGILMALLPARIVHELSTATTKSFGVLQRPCLTEFGDSLRIPSRTYV